MTDCRPSKYPLLGTTRSLLARLGHQASAAYLCTSEASALVLWVPFPTWESRLKDSIGLLAQTSTVTNVGAVGSLTHIGAPLHFQGFGSGKKFFFFFTPEGSSLISKQPSPKQLQVWLLGTQQDTSLLLPWQQYRLGIWTSRSYPGVQDSWLMDDTSHAKALLGPGRGADPHSRQRD